MCAIFRFAIHVFLHTLPNPYFLTFVTFVLRILQSTDATEPPAVPTSDSNTVPKLVIWGTNVVIQETKEKFKKFLKEFVDEDAEGMGDDFVPTEPLYMQRFEEV